MDDAVAKAIQVCLKKLKMNPQDWNARAFLGRCYLKKGMQEEARKELEEAVKTVSNNRVVFKLLADIYEKEGRIKEAKWIYRIFSSMDIEGSETDPSLHAIKAEEPIKKEAISDLKEKKPIKKEVKSTQEAKEPVIKEKTAKKEEKPKEKKKISTTTIADIYLKQGYTDRALSIYREILTKDPTNTEIQEKINSITEKKEESLPLKQMESPDDLKDIETQKEITPIAKRKKEEASPPKKMESPDDLKNKMVIATLNNWLANLQGLEGKSI